MQFKTLEFKFLKWLVLGRSRNVIRADLHWLLGLLPSENAFEWSLEKRERASFLLLRILGHSSFAFKIIGDIGDLCINMKLGLDHHIVLFTTRDCIPECVWQ